MVVFFPCRKPVREHDPLSGLHPAECKHIPDMHGCNILLFPRSKKECHPDHFLCHGSVKVQKTVYDAHGVMLEPEVKIIRQEED